ncbi:acyl-CoA thioesterase [bacterium]|nr:acyl-CoA thioesterase [bacterium]
MPFETSSQITVRYAETDRMGVVYHANYLVWMEVGRTDFLAELGFPYGELEESGVLFPLCETSMRLLGPCRYEDRLTVVTRLTRLQSRKVVFGYRVLKAEELMVTGVTEHICTDRLMKVRKLPPDLYEALDRALDRTDEKLTAGSLERTGH